MMWPGSGRVSYQSFRTMVVRFLATRQRDEEAEAPPVLIS